MSTVKPLRELAPSEDVIDIKPEPDDLIDEDLNFVQENPLSQKKTTVLSVGFWYPIETAHSRPGFQGDKAPFGGWLAEERNS